MSLKKQLFPGKSAVKIVIANILSKPWAVKFMLMGYKLSPYFMYLTFA